MLTTESIDALSAALASRHASRTPSHTWNLSALASVVEYTPEDMTVTVQAGATLAAVQQNLARHNQWLPIDPPNADSLTIGALIATDASGPRRYGYGTIRDHLIGIRLMQADGACVKSGGKVVKNVAGYDLMKLLVGSRGTLGIIVEATFKVQPRPPAECALACPCASLDELESRLNTLAQSPVNPVILDAHGNASRPVLVVGFSGTQREVDWQSDQIAPIGPFQQTALGYDGAFRSSDAPPLTKESVLPSKLPQTLRALGDQPFVARAGNGVFYHRGPRVTPPADLPIDLMRRLKETFDPHQLLPSMPW